MMRPWVVALGAGVLLLVVGPSQAQTCSQLRSCAEGDAPQLYQALLLLKRSRHLNISAFCREAIAEKLERLEVVN